VTQTGERRVERKLILVSRGKGGGEGGGRKRPIGQGGKILFLRRGEASSGALKGL